MMQHRRNKRRTAGSQNYWQSYSDMMAALLLMFVLIMAFTLAQSLSTYEEKVRIQEEQNALLAQQQTQLDAQQKQLDELIGVKADIIEALGGAFQGSGLSLNIDGQTGAISLNSDLLFSYDSAELSPEGMAFLKDFFPRYISVLLSDTYRPYVSEIIIEGHTDTDGDYMYNLDLSQKRAYSVAEYSLNEENQVLPSDELAQLRQIMTANGKSFSTPVYDANGQVDAARSRRVEIKFRLQDEEMIRQMQEILEGTPS